MVQSLAGLLVVSLEQAVAAPLCTARLADAGARVIKVERAEGDFARGYDHVVNGESAYFVWLNRGKQSLAADLKEPADLALVKAMLGKADIFVQNLAPGAIDRLGLGIATLRARNPRLICCSITGYGESGPYRDAKAYDLLVQCESGLASVTGTPEAPGRVGVSVADIACGMNAHAAILDALLLRERTGKGASLSVSLFDSLAEWMAVPLLHHDYGGRAPGRVGIAHASIVPYGVPVYVDTFMPGATPDSLGPPLRRLMVAQDTGGAIKGPVRGDIFWGPGERAESIAGRLKSPGMWWVLLPKPAAARLGR